MTLRSFLSVWYFCESLNNKRVGEIFPKNRLGSPHMYFFLSHFTIVKGPFPSSRVARIILIIKSKNSSFSETKLILHKIIQIRRELHTHAWWSPLNACQGASSWQEFQRPCPPILVLSFQSPLHSSQRAYFDCKHMSSNSYPPTTNLSHSSISI